MLIKLKILLKYIYILYKSRKDKFIRLRYMERYKSDEIIFLNNKLTVIDGASFYYSEKEIFKNNLYDFSNDSKENLLIIDCGSNIGLSIIYFKNKYPNCRIIAFEADPFVHKICKSNVSTYLNEEDILLNLALWDSISELEFMSEGADGGRISNTIDSIKKVKVKTDLLSNYLNEKVDFLKIDIEGAEFRVLNECKEKLRNVDKIFIEYHSFYGEEQSLDVILKILKDSGFRIQIHTQFASSRPFKELPLQLGMDLQLNIFGSRNV